MTTKKMMDAYNERQKKQVSKSENKTKTGNRDMKGGNRDPQSIPGKNMLKMGKIASDAKKSAKMDSTEKSTRGQKASAPKKNPIITPKMIKDAGFTNLRDYMNFKSGKTRKGGGKAVRTEAFKKKNPAGVMGDSFKGGGKVKKMMGGGMTKGKMMKYRGGGIVQQGARPTKYI